MDDFAARVLAWFDAHGRTDLPWQQERSPYRVWVSEIMLQQTRVATVIPFFERFMARFPTVESLAAAPLDEVLHHWSGLGYYARGRNLHRAAQLITDAGTFPDDLDDLSALPGIGRSTAGAIVAIAFGRRAAILDGNVRRVLARYHAVPGHAGQASATRALWSHAEAHTPNERLADYTQAMMDLGATVCTRTPACTRCPLGTGCAALATDAIAQFPEPRPRKTLPVRECRMFVIADAGGRVLLERRPRTGLWGGLWNPPERDRDTTLGALARELDLDLETRHTAPTLRHTFTHFHLDIEPVIAAVDGTADGGVRDGGGYCWYREGETRLGLSAVAVKLLASLPTTFELT